MIGTLQQTLTAPDTIVASLYIPIMVFNAAGASWDYAFYYALTIGVEVLILAIILRSAWTWPRTHSYAAEVLDVRVPTRDPGRS